MLIIVLAVVGMFVFAFAAWWTGRDRESTPAEIEQAVCEEDDGWSDSDTDDFTEYFAEFGEF
jgi:hypothetical protein